MKKCELCPSTATMYCDSDSASLCWDCDSKVHSANFLVERHSRSLLCHVCQSPTAWAGSGPSLPRTLSVCHSCLRRCNKAKEPKDEREEREERDCDTEDEDEEEDIEEEDSEEDEDEEEEEEEEEQVVPSPPGSSSGDESSSEKGMSSKKRLRDFCSDDDLGCSSGHGNAISFLARDSEASVDSFDRIKRLRTRSDKAEAVISGACDMDQETLTVGSRSADSS